MRITCHCLVKNEAQFLWYAVMSVIDHVDEILLWDTGSRDGTVEIIKEIMKTEGGRQKTEFREVGDVSPGEFTKVRQEMLDATDGDWIFILDGDEIWWQDSIRHFISAIMKKGDRIESIVVPTINLVGDIYHYQEEPAGKYKLVGRVGHLNLRAVSRKIPGLHVDRPYPDDAWLDGDNAPIQDRDPGKILFLDAPYLHATFLRPHKFKYELGIPFPPDFYYPEVLFRRRPEIVPSVWKKLGLYETIRSGLETPLKKVKRRV